MCANKLSVKERILQTVVEILINETNIEDITVRKIAEKANVNSALINYHFQSKDNLINKAVEVCMNNFTKEMYEPTDLQLNPIDRLRKMIIDIADFSYNTVYLSQIAVRNDINTGSINTGTILLPLLKQIFPHNNDLELKIISMQIILPIQVFFLNTEVYNQYFYTRLEDKLVRDKIINQILNNILNEKEIYNEN